MSWGNTAKAQTGGTYLPEFKHPKGDDSWVTEGGLHDGRYRLRIAAIEDNPGKKLMKLRFDILESSGDRRPHPAGSQAEHAVFRTKAPGESETKGLILDIASMLGWELPDEQELSPRAYGEAFAKIADEICGEGQPAAGFVVDATVSTDPQKGDSSKPFTHVRYGWADAFKPGETIAPAPAPAQPDPYAGWPDAGTYSVDDARPEVQAYLRHCGVIQ